MRKMVFCISLTMAMTRVAFAQTSDPPKPDFSSFATFEGSWSCKLVRTSDNSGVGFTEPIAYAMDPSGYWMIMTESDGKRYITYDNRARRWVRSFIGASGSYEFDASPGWSGTSIAFKQIASHGGGALGTITLTKVNAVTYTVHAERSTPKGIDSFDERCEKKT